MQHYSPTLPIATALFGLTGMLIAAPVVVPDFEIATGASATLDRFGSSLARGPGYLAIGSPLSDSPAPNGGKVTIGRPIWIGPPEDPLYHESTMFETIEHANAGDNANFGDALAASGDRLFIGSPGWRIDASVSTTQGAVFIYDVPLGPLALSTFLQMISPETLDTYDKFGASVASGLDDSGNVWLAVGLPGRNNDAGAVWMYQHDVAADAWTLQQTIQPAGLQAGDDFGAAVALDGDLLVIGAPGTNNNAGHVYIRRLLVGSGTWDAAHDVAASATSATGEFGSAVDVWQYFVLIGAPDGTGHVSLWEDVSTAGLFNYVMDLAPDSWTDIEGWGTAVAINATRAVVGSPPHTGSGPDGIAAVFRDVSSGDFQLVAMLGEGDWGSDARNGSCVLLDGETAWVGAPRAHIDTTTSGAVGRWDVSRTPGCPGDLDFDFMVNAVDLAALLNDWLSGGDSDLTGDDETDIADLLELLEHWGSCL